MVIKPSQPHSTQHKSRIDSRKKNPPSPHRSEKKQWRRISSLPKKISPPVPATEQKIDSDENASELLHQPEELKVELKQPDESFDDKKSVEEPVEISADESFALSQIRFYIPVPKCSTERIRNPPDHDGLCCEPFDAWNPPSDDWEYAERIIAEMEEMKLMHEDT